MAILAPERIVNESALKALLESVGRGETDPRAALDRLRRLPFETMGFATVDHHRAIRCGFPEVIFCPGKTPEQVSAIFARLADQDVNVLATRATAEHFAAVAKARAAARYHETARAISLIQDDSPGVGHVAVVSAGTSDLPVAEEARVTAEAMGARVTTHYDVGVAGLHRLLAHGEALQSATALVVAAGMEGALPSVVGGLVASPVIAVPTSVGYGANFGGLAALLGMLHSSSSNVCVVNIDNGFAGGHIAAMINRAVAAGRPEGAATPRGSAHG